MSTQRPPPSWRLVALSKRAKDFRPDGARAVGLGTCTALGLRTLRPRVAAALLAPPHVDRTCSAAGNLWVCGRPCCSPRLPPPSFMLIATPPGAASSDLVLPAGGRLRVGRAPENDVRLPPGWIQISSKHCEFAWDAAKVGWLFAITSQQLPVVPVVPACARRLRVGGGCEQGEVWHRCSACRCVARLLAGRVHRRLPAIAADLHGLPSCLANQLTD